MKSLVLVIKQSFLNSKSTLSSDIEARTRHAVSWLLPTGNTRKSREQRKQGERRRDFLFRFWLFLTVPPQQRPFISTVAFGFSELGFFRTSFVSPLEVLAPTWQRSFSGGLSPSSQGPPLSMSEALAAARHDPSSEVQAPGL